MGSFFGLNFMFDKEFSRNYDLYIQSINGQGVSNSSSGSNVSIMNGSVIGKPTKDFYGIAYNDVLTFEMTVMSLKPIYGMVRTKVEKWLFQKMNYSKLQIIQIDLQNIYFNCFLLNPQSIYVGNVCYGFSFTVECDAPWAWQVDKTYLYKNTTNQFIQNLKLYCNSDTNDFTYPYIEFKMNSLGGDIRIQNSNFVGEDMEFEMLPPNEIVKIQNDTHIIECSSIQYVSDKFNKEFFKLLSTNNNLTIIGNVEYFKVIVKNAKKVGG